METIQDTETITSKQFSYFTYKDVMDLYEPTSQNEMKIKDLSTCGAIALSDLLKNNSNIISLDVEFGMGRKGINMTLQKLCNGIEAVGNLRSLKIVSDSESSLASICPGLSNNNTLEELILPSANLEVINLNSIGSFINKAPVNYISLPAAFEQNYIERDVEAFLVFVAKIKNSNTLKRLDFHNNRMDGVNALKLLEALNDKDYFELTIDHNVLSFEAFDKVAQYNRDGKNIIVKYY